MWRAAGSRPARLTPGDFLQAAMMRTSRTIAAALAAALVSSGAWASCANPNALGTSRVVAVNPRVTPAVGGADYGVRLPLNRGEVVLTFDDGPNAATTPVILRALAQECVHATFFMVGRQAQAFPQTARQVAAAGHTVGTHSQTHPLGYLHGERATREIDAGIASVTRALGRSPAPFFRFPGLYRTREAELYLRRRGIMVWSVDVDSYDWKHNNTSVMLQSAVSRLAARGGGILLMHDVKQRTAMVLPKLLAMLKARGLRVVHVVPGGALHPGMIAAAQQKLQRAAGHPLRPIVVTDNAPDQPLHAGRRGLASNSFETIFRASIRR